MSFTSGESTSWADDQGVAPVARRYPSQQSVWGPWLFCEERAALPECMQEMPSNEMKPLPMGMLLVRKQVSWRVARFCASDGWEMGEHTDAVMSACCARCGSWMRVIHAVHCL